MKNKGFSLVELIIVIAIMAILAAAIAPALIRYIDKSRRSDDVAAAETINTACQAALANEDAYDEVQLVMKGLTGTGATTLATAAVNSTSWTATNVTSGGTFLYEMDSSTGGGPAIKYKKGNASYWTVGVSTNGKPVVWLGTGSGGTQTELQPTIDKFYK